MSGNTKAKTAELSEILNKFCDPSKLERDRSEEKLLVFDLNNIDPNFVVLWISDKFTNTNSVENCIGSLSVCKVFLNKCGNLPEDFLQLLSNQCIQYQSHIDSRVRNLAAECMGLLCHISGLNKFNYFIDIIKNNIKDNIGKLNEPHNSVITVVQNSKSLEAWMKCFEEIIKGLGVKFEKVVTDEMFDGVFEAIIYGNRFIRETGFYLLGYAAENHGCSKSRNVFLKMCESFRRGMGDNWSQVRLSASVAARKILMVVKPPDVDISEIHSILLPGICMNRYYLAEGVRLYNQETWKNVVGDRGKELLENHLEETVSYYIEQSFSDNYAVRETACSCMSEIALKLNKNAVQPYLIKMFDVLLKCLNDKNWSVRDLACLTLGRLVSGFPAEARKYREDAMIPLFYSHVTDKVICGRESGAFTISSIVGAFDHKETSYLKNVVDFILENLEGMINQKSDQPDADNKSRFVIVKEKFNQGVKIISNFDKYSNSISGSEGHIGCGSFTCNTDSAEISSEPWEKADGSILLIAELALRSKDCHSYMDKLIPAMIKASSYQHYSNYVYLLATACKVIGDLCNCMEKSRFKSYLPDFLHIIYNTINCNCQFSISTAEKTLQTISSKLGSNILKGRIEMYNSDLLSKTEHLFSV